MERYCIQCGKITSQKSDNCFVCEAGHENWINPAIGSVVFVCKDDKILFGIRSIDPAKASLTRRAASLS